MKSYDFSESGSLLQFLSTRLLLYDKNKHSSLLISFYHRIAVFSMKSEGFQSLVPYYSSLAQDSYCNGPMRLDPPSQSHRMPPP